jgi:phosphate transport system substrate-binding protein
MPDRNTLFGLIALVAMMSAVPGCSEKLTDEPAITITGAGSTLVKPLFLEWFKQYRKAHPGVAVAYEAVGSGEGTKLFGDEAVDFGASDAAMTDDKMAAAKRKVVLIPITAGSVVLAYNPDGMPPELKLSRSVYADIFLGKIAAWDDERIAKLNPGVKLPKREIKVVVRSDASGTTFAFTNHLTAISEEWQKGPGAAAVVKWPGQPVRSKGNEGVAGSIKKNASAVGYVDYATAEQSGLSMAWLENKEGNYINPAGGSGLETLRRAKLPDNLRLFIPDPAGKDSYPIVTYSWLLLYGQYGDAQKLDALKDVVRWCLHDGQNSSESLGYIRLPADTVAAAERAVASISGPSH